MKCKVIKEFAGIEVGQEMDIKESQLEYMIESGYVEVIETKAIDKAPENKMIDTDYKNKGGRPKK